LLTAYLFVDWGDNFPGGTLSTTLGDLYNVYNHPDSNQDILGPKLTSTAGYADGTSLNIVRQMFTPEDRAAMMANVIRAYRPLDVQVIDLTTTSQTTPDGRSVTAAASMSDVIATLQAGPLESKDAYIFVAQFIADPGGPHEKVYGPDGGGLSPDDGLDLADLTRAQNLHDDVALVFTDTTFGYNFNTMNNIAHEAGHNFGLQHSLTNPSGNAATDLLHLSEVTSYLNTNDTTSSIAFSRYPMIRGNDNSPPSGLVNYNSLVARDGDQTPWDQLATDPHVGPNLGYSFVSGTGAHDRIQISRTGLSVTVSVTAYADAAQTIPITVPGAGGNTWSYSFTPSLPILVFAGASDDIIEINGDLGVPVEIDGMLGTDQLLVNTTSSLAATWTPSPSATPGVDRLSAGSPPVLSYGGTLSWGATTVLLQNFEPGSSLQVLNSTQIFVNGSSAADQLQLTPMGAYVQISGTLNGTPAIPVMVLNPDSITVNGLAGSDSLVVHETPNPITAAISFNGGGGSGIDTLQILGGAFSLIQGTLTDAGSGNLSLDGIPISFTGLEPVLINVGTVNDILFNLPNVVNPDVLIQDDGFGPDPNGNTVNTSAIAGSTFEFTEFTNPLNSLLVAGSFNFSNTMSLDALDPAWWPGSVVRLFGGSAADNLHVQATPGNGSITLIDGSLGADLIQAGVTATGGSSSLDSFAGPLYVVGGAGPDIDVLELRDDLDTNANTYDIIPGTVSRSAGVLINFNTIEVLRTFAGTQSDTFLSTPLLGTSQELHGNLPTLPTSPGDSLTWRGTGDAVKSISGPGDGSIISPPLGTVRFTSMETVQPGPTASLSDLLDLTTPDMTTLGSQNSRPNEIVVQRDLSGIYLEVLIDFDTTSGPGPQLFSRQLYSGISSLRIIGGTDADQLTINHANGLVTKTFLFAGNGPTNSGEPNGDTLAVIGTPAGGLGVTARETYRVGATEDAGRWILDPDGNMGPGASLPPSGDEMIVDFTGLEPADTDVFVPIFDVVWNAAFADNIRIEDGGLLPGGVSLRVVDLSGTFETFRFANKNVVRLHLNGGADIATLNYTVPAAGLAALEVFGNGDPAILGVVPDDNAPDRFSAISNSGAFNTWLYGQGGDDRLNNFLAIAPAGSSSLAQINSPIVFVGGESAADNDEVLLTNAAGPATSVVTLNSFSLTGAAPAPISWSQIETFAYGGTQVSDTINVLSTAAETRYAIYTNDGADDVVTIGNTRAAFDAAVYSGTMTSILGSILVAHDHAPNAGPDAQDTLNIDASGDAALAATATIGSIGVAGFPLDGFVDFAPTTRISGFAPASIDYQHGTNSLGDVGDRLEVLRIRASQGSDAIRVFDTTASVSTSIDAREGNDNVLINADNLSADNLFQGFDGNDDFSLLITSHIGSTGFVSPTTSVRIEGNGNPLADSANRDRLTVVDGNAAFSRSLNYDILDSPGDLDILASTINAGLFGPEDGGLLPLSVRSMETLRFDSMGAPNDLVTVTGRTSDDDLTVAFAPSLSGQLLAGSSAFVFLNGNPYTAYPGAVVPADSLAGNLPGRAGGGDGTDMLINGISPTSGLILDGSGSTVIGNRAVIQGVSENHLIDSVAQTAGLDVFNLGIGSGVLTAGAGAGNAYDALSFNGATASDLDMGSFASAANQITGSNNISGPLVPVTLAAASFINGTAPVIRPGLILNGGDELGARPSGIADNLFVTLHSQFSIAVNGNLPVPGGLATDGFPAGDQLSMSTPESFSIWSDKSTPPHVTIAPGNSPYTAILSSIERTRLYPGNGTLNLIGDQNNPTVDQTDAFRVLGVDVDPGGSADGGVQELALSINGSSPILVDGVNRLNVYGFDLSGQNLNNPNPLAPDTPTGPPVANLDSLEITPFADNAGGPGGNAPRGWGLQTIFNEGSPASTDGDPSDLLIVHTAIGVSTGLNVFGGGVTSDDILLQPSGPDNGEVRILSGVDGSTTAVVAWIGNTDIIVVDDDGAVSDTDRLFIHGTDPGTTQVSGNDTFQVNFSASGAISDPMVTVRDADSGRLLYRLRGFTTPMGTTGPFQSIAFDMLGGNDSMTILNTAIPAPGGTTGPHVTVAGGADDDSVTVQWPYASGLVPGHLTWDGGAGRDSLSFNDPPEIPAPLRSVVYTPGPIPGSGRTEHTLSNGIGIVDFIGLEPVFDFTNAASVTVNAGNASNSISYYTDYGVGTLGTIINGGNYLTDGIYLNVPLTGGSGTGARADVTVSGGTVANVALTADGAGYLIGDVLTAPTSSLGGGPGGLLIPVTSFSGTVAVDNQEILVFSNKSSLIINGEGGSDQVSINNPITPSGLAFIVVNGGDPTGSDSLLVNGRAGVFDNLLVTPAGTGSGSLSAITPGFVPVLFSGTEELQIADRIADNEQLNFAATAATDTFTWTPGTSGDSGSMQGQAVGGPAFAFVPVTWSGIAGAIVAATTAGDTLIVNGTAGDDLFTVTARTTPAAAPATLPGISLTTGTISYTPVFSGHVVSTDQMVLAGLAGNDTFRLQFNPLSSGGQLTPIRIEGGESGQFSDSAEFLPVSNAVTTVDLNSSTILSTGANPVNFTGLEALAITGSDGSSDAMFVNGLGAPGGLSLLSLNAADTGGLDDGDTIDVTCGISPDSLDYTPLSPVSALLQRRGGNTQLRVTSLNGQAGDLTVSGGGSVDQLNIITPAGNNRIDIQRAGNFAAVTVVSGGNPGGGTAWLPVDFTLIAGPATFDNLQLLGNSGDDLLHIDNSGGLLSLPGGINFDGGIGRDSLLLTGSTAVGGADYNVGPNPGDGRVVHTAAAPLLQIQTVTFSGLEPIIDLVTAATLTVNGTDADNAISYNVGPNSGVVSPLNPLGLSTGRVAIDGFEPMEFANKSAFTIRGLGGSDQFNLRPATPAALASIAIDGGDPTTGSDEAVINGSIAAEAFRVAVTGSESALIFGAGAVPISLTATETLRLNGQGGADSLTWVSPAGPDVVRFVPGGSDSAGSITAVNSGGLLLPMSFSNIPVSGPAANLTFADAIGRSDLLTILGTAASDSVQVSIAGLVSIRSLQNAFLSPLVATPGIDQLALQTLEGDDLISLPGTHPFASLIVDAGTPDSGSDTLSILGSGGAVTVALTTQSVTEAPAAPISFIGIEQINLNSAGGNVNVSTTNERDVTTYYPETINSGTLTNDHSSPRISFSNCGSLTINQLGGSDVLEIQGTALAETITLNLPARLLSVGVLEPLNFIGTNTEFVWAAGQAGNDGFTITTDPVIPLFVDGGDPIGITPGDSILLLAGAAGVVFEPGPESDEGAFLVGTNQRISYDHIESLTVSGPGGAWIAGTGADDDITIIARDSSTHGGADGVRDFTSQVNSGPQILWLDAPLLLISAGAGDDDVIVRAPAPNNANWNVSLMVSGGPPAAGPYSDGDRFELETPQNSPDTILYTPTAAESGLLIINESGSGIYNPLSDTSIQLGGPFAMPPLPGLPALDPGGLETLVYDGQNGNDVVAIYGDAAGVTNDTFIHQPDTEPDDGRILVNSLLPLQYTDLGTSGLISIDGLAGTDVLSVDGTASNDDFTVTPVTGLISHALATGTLRVAIAQSRLERVVLEGYSGSDTFRIPGSSPSATIVHGGTPDVGSDTIIYTSTGATIVDLGLSTIDDDGVNPPADVTWTAVEQIIVSGAGFGLTLSGTAVDDMITYIPQGTASGQLQANGVLPVVRFSGVAGLAVSAAAGTGDVVIVQGTTNHDVITVDSPTRTVTVTNAIGTILQPIVLSGDVETVRIESGLGNDTILVVPALPVGPSTPAPQVLPTNLLIDVNGGPPGASDALVLAGSAAGGQLPATDFVVHNRSRTPDSGRLRVFRSIPGAGIIPLPDISYADVEIVSPLVATNANPAIGPQLLQQGPDLFEQNESLQNAAWLGSGPVLNASNLAIFPDLNEHPFVPNDSDFFRVVAHETGTLDFQVYFNTYAGLLPGGGDIDIRVLDSDGTVIAGSGSPLLNAAFGVPNAANPSAVPPVAAGNNPNERVRIPAVAGQTYYLQVFNPTATRFNTNGYHLTVINTPAPVPAQLELNDALVNAALLAAGVPAGGETAFTIPPGLLNPTPGFYVGKTLHFLTGTNAGLSLRITSQAAPNILRVTTSGLRGPGAGGDAVRVESSDTGRSRYDNVTRDNTPLILFRLDDNLLQQDLPGNPTGGPAPDQLTRIPWNNTFTAAAGASVAVAPAADPALYTAGSIPGLTAGYRVAVYEEGTTTTPGGPGPNGLWGYATMIAPGVYQFNFGNTATNNLFGPASLTNGSHFLTARVEMIDPAAAPGPVNVQARGVRSTAFEIVVDADAPTVGFGDLVSTIDGLHPTSDSSVPGIAATISDRITNDTTPTFWGTAEANSIVRAYLDVDASGTINGPDLLLGQATAIPIDGSDQAPFGQWSITSTIDMNSPVVLAALSSARDGLRRILISAEDVAGNMAMPAGAATPQLTLSIFIDTQGPQLMDPDAAGQLQTIQIANPAPLGPVNGINSFNLFALKPVNATQGPTPLVSGLTIHMRDLPARVLPFIYEAIQAPSLAGSIIPPLASVSPLAGAPAIAALAPIPVPAGASALNPADFSVEGDATGAIPILSAYFVPIAAPAGPAVPAQGYIVLTFHTATAGDFLPDDRYTLTLRDSLVDPANNRLDGENQGVMNPSGGFFTPTGDGQPGGSFVARFTVDSRPEAATFGQGGIFVDANGNWNFDPNAPDASNRDLTFQMGIDTDFIFSGKHSAAQTVGTRITNGFDKLGAYGRSAGSYRWLLDTNDDGVADLTIVQPTGFTVGGISFTGNGIPFTGNFVGATGSADEIAIFDGVNWFLDTAAPFNQITAADTAFAGTLRGLPVAGDFDGDGLTDLAVHSASANRFQFDYAAVGGLTGVIEGTINHGFSGVLERPIAGDLNLDGITDLGLAVPNQDGVSTNSRLSWYVLQSTGPAVAGTTANLNHAFSPVPLGPDLYRQFGNNLAVPMLGNFDPPPADRPNTAPVLNLPQFLSLPDRVATVTIDTGATDADGNKVTVSAAADSLEWYLRDSLGLKAGNSYSENWGGRGEKWIRGNGGVWYYITPSGGLYRWDQRAVKLPSQKVTGTLIATLSPAVHANPRLLTDAVQTSIPVTVSVSDGRLSVTAAPSFQQPFVVRVHATDGVASSKQVVQVQRPAAAAVSLDQELGLSLKTASANYNWGGRQEKWLAGNDGQWYFITSDGTVRVWDRSRSASGNVVAQLDPVFWQNPALLANASLIDLDQRYGFKSDGKLSTNARGQMEKWFRDGNNNWHFILPTGEVRRWDGKSGANGDLVAQLDNSSYLNPARLYRALDDVFSEWMGLMD
jgi:hypothetical protein